MNSFRRSACLLLVLLVAAGCGDDDSGAEATDASTGSTGGDGTSMGTSEPSTTAPTTDHSTTIDSASAGEDSTSGATSTSSATESGSTGTSSANGTSGTSSTGTGTGETGTGSTGTAELGPYGDCVGEMLPCPAGSFCLLVPQTGVCTPEDCTQASDCPEPPPGGDAPVICLDANGDDVDDCRIDCSKGQTCPTGMECFSEEICVWS